MAQHRFCVEWLVSLPTGVSGRSKCMKSRDVAEREYERRRKISGNALIRDLRTKEIVRR